MKTTVTPNRAKALVISLFLLLSFAGYAQPDYSFRNGTLIAGSDRQIGAKYRYSNIKANTDGIVTITDINKITLDDIDGGSGFDEAFQPVISVPKKTKGYVEFKVDFVTHNTNMPRLMLEVPLTAIDIDGYVYPDEKVYEFDEFATSPVYVILYDFIGSSLNVNIGGSWVTAMNKTAKDYPGVDTIQKDVMFSMVHAGVTSITFRVGADNKSNNSVQRLRSVYFKKFLFSNSAILSQSPVMNFNGKKEKNNVSLNWKFTSTTGISGYSLERSLDGKDYTAVTSKNFEGQEIPETASYTDIASGSKSYAYRLKVTNMSGKVSYSQVIYFKDDNTSTNKELNIYPNVIQSGASIQVNSDAAMKSKVQVVDYAGRVVYNSDITLNKGTNSLYLDVAGKLAKGNYVVVLPVNGTQLSQKIVIR